MSLFAVDNLCSLVLSTPGFDDLLLTGETVDSNGATYCIEACQVDESEDGMSWGAPEPVDVTVERWMTDGAVAQTQNYANRTLTFSVMVTAATSTELAAGEAALALRAGASGLLTWTSPEGEAVAPPTVFVVWTWNFTHAFDDLGELRLQRIYAVTMTAEPDVRSDQLTVVDAITTSDSPTVTEVDACGSTTGWSGTPHAPTTSGGAVKESVAGPAFGSGAPTALSLTRTGSVTGMDVTPYLMLTVLTSGGSTSGWAVSVDTRPLTKAGQVGTTSYWKMPAGKTSFTKLKVSVTINIGGGNTGVLAVADVSKTDEIGVVGSRKSLTRSLAVGGSVKTAGSIQVASPDDTPLDTVMVYTQPDNGQGFNPGLRLDWTSANTVTADTSANSGFHETFPAFTGTITASVPPDVLPEATYAVIMRAKSDTTGTMTVQYRSAVDGYFDDETRLSGSMDFTSANTWTWGVIGVTVAPNQVLPVGSTLATVLFFVATAVPGTVLVDDIYLLDITHGDLTLVDVGGTCTRLWIDAPDADPVRNLPAIYIGIAADRSDAAGIPASRIKAMGDHRLDPSGMVLATVTDSVDDAVVSASFYQRWHTHAGA